MATPEVTPAPPQLSLDLKRMPVGEEGKTKSQVPRGYAPSPEDPAEVLPRSSLGLHGPVTSNVISAPTTPPAVPATLAPHCPTPGSLLLWAPPTMTLLCNRTICTCSQHPWAPHPVLPSLFLKHLLPPTSCAISSLPSFLQCPPISTQCGLSESRDSPVHRCAPSSQTEPGTRQVLSERLQDD